MNGKKSQTSKRQELFQLFSQYYHLEILETELLDELDLKHSNYITNILSNKLEEVVTKKEAKYGQINYCLNNFGQNESD